MRSSSSPRAPSRPPRRYESGSDEGKTPAGHLADQTGLPLPLQTGTRVAHAGIDERYA